MNGFRYHRSERKQIWEIEEGLEELKESRAERFTDGYSLEHEFRAIQRVQGAYGDKYDVLCILTNMLNENTGERSIHWRL